MARGETKLGSERLQNAGSTSGARRGGVIIPRTIVDTFLIPGANAATAANYGIVFTAPTIARQLDPTGSTPPLFELVSVRERHEAAGTDAGAVTLQVVKVPSGTAKGAGVNMLASALNLKSAPDANQDGTLSSTAANIQIGPGDSIALVPSGVLTAVAGVAVTIELRRI